MKYTWFGFDQKKACELDLNIEELAVLSWFIDFKESNKMKKYTDKNGKEFYWVSYKYFAQECPIFFKDKTNASERSMKNKIQRLFSGNLSKVLERKIIKVSGNGKLGTEMYFGLNEEVYNELVTPNRNSNKNSDHCSNMGSEYFSNMGSDCYSNMGNNYSINNNKSINNIYNNIYCPAEAELHEEFEVVEEKETKKNDTNEVVKEIIEYLNTKTDSNYKYTTKATKSLINARLKEGFTIDDFKKVIDNKAASWKGTEYEKYLRPQTLFSPSKFEGYINEKPYTRKMSVVEYKKSRTTDGYKQTRFNNFEERSCYNDDEFNKDLENALLHGSTEDERDILLAAMRYNND